MNPIESSNNPSVVSNIKDRIKNGIKNVKPSTVGLVFGIGVLCLAIVGYVVYTYLLPRIKEARAKLYGNLSNEVEDNDTNQKNINVYLFETNWCPHCKKVKPVWDEFARKYNNNTINGYHIKIDESTTIDCDSTEGEEKANKFDIDSYPTIKAQKDNEIIEFDAKPTKENLEAFMEEITKN